MLRETSHMMKIFQNEENLNAACGPVMRKSLHDFLSRNTIALVDVEDWSANKEKIHPTRLEVSVNSFKETGIVYRTRALLECERRFFNNETEETFAQSKSDFEMKLTDWEKDMLTLDTRICWSKKVFDDVEI